MAPEADPQPARPKRQAPGLEAGQTAELVALLCGAMTVITANIGLLGPLLLQLADEFEVSPAQAGLLATATALPWALTAPILGPLSDRLGRRPVLGASLFGLGLATAAGALAPSFGGLLATRVISGVLASAGPMGWVNAGFGLAALVGIPAIGAVGGAYGWRAAFLVTGLTSSALALLIWWRLPDSSGRLSPGRSVLSAYRAVLAQRRFQSILIANVCERSVYATVALYLAAFLMQRYGLSLVEVAPLLALTALGSIVGNLLGGWLADRLGQPLLFGLGQVVAAGLALPALVLAPSQSTSLLLFTGFWLATSASRPAIIALASGSSAAHRGTALGIFSFTNQAGWALGPALAGLAFALSGYSALGLLCALASLAAALLILPLTRATS
jgi:predicted MFS family arabinose efflux permease